MRTTWQYQANRMYGMSSDIFNGWGIPTVEKRVTSLLYMRRPFEAQCGVFRRIFAAGSIKQRMASRPDLRYLPGGGKCPAGLSCRPHPGNSKRKRRRIGDCQY